MFDDQNSLLGKAEDLLRGAGEIVPYHGMDRLRAHLGALLHNESYPAHLAYEIDRTDKANHTPTGKLGFVGASAYGAARTFAGVFYNGAKEAAIVTAEGAEKAAAVLLGTDVSTANAIAKAESIYAAAGTQAETIQTIASARGIIDGAGVAALPHLFPTDTVAHAEKAPNISLNELRGTLTDTPKR